MNAEPAASRWKAIAPHTGPGPEIRVYQMPPDEIGRLCSLMEARDGIGLVRTLDRRRGLVELWLMPGLMDESELLLAAFGREVPMQRMNRELD